MVPEAYCPDLWCTPQVGMGKIVAAVQCSETGGERKKKFWCASLRGATSLLEAQEKEARGQRREAKRRDGDEANSQQPKGCTVRIRTPLSQKIFSAFV